MRRSLATQSVEHKAAAVRSTEILREQAGERPHALGPRKRREACEEPAGISRSGLLFILAEGDYWKRIETMMRCARRASSTGETPAPPNLCGETSNAERRRSNVEGRASKRNYSLEFSCGLVDVLGMGATFWIRRFLLVFATGLAIITGAQMLKGHTLGYSVSEGLLWAAVAASIFTGGRIYQSRGGQHCAICRDTPETSMQAGVKNKARRSEL